MNEQERQLIELIKTGKTDEVCQLLKSQPAININVQDENSVPAGLTPLHYSIEYAQLDSFNLLLDNGANPFIANADGHTAYTCCNGKFRVGAASLTKDSFPIMAEASQEQNLAEEIGSLIGRALTELEQKQLNILNQPYGKVYNSSLADLEMEIKSHLNNIPASNLFSYKLPEKLVNFLSGQRITPLRILQRKFSLALSKYCKNNEEVVNSLPLFDAVKCGNIRKVRGLLTNGANPDVQECKPALNSNTPLYYAGDSGNKEMVELLIEFGANPAISLADGQNPLSAAAGNGHLAVIDKLSYSKTGYVNADAALWCLACFDKDADRAIAIAEKLWELGPNVNYEFAGPKVTPLLMAAEYRQSELARWLIDKGANVVTNTAGYTPLDFAVSNADAKTAVCLLKGYSAPVVRGEADKIELVYEPGSRSDTGVSAAYIASEALQQSLDKFIPRMEAKKTVSFLASLKTEIENEVEKQQNANNLDVSSALQACLESLDKHQLLKEGQTITGSPFKEVPVINIEAGDPLSSSLSIDNPSGAALPVRQREVTGCVEVAEKNDGNSEVVTPMANMSVANPYSNTSSI